MRSCLLTYLDLDRLLRGRCITLLDAECVAQYCIIVWQRKLICQCFLYLVLVVSFLYILDYNYIYCMILLTYLGLLAYLLIKFSVGKLDLFYCLFLPFCFLLHLLVHISSAQSQGFQVWSLLHGAISISNQLIQHN